jgi:hypothetical protein
MSATKQTERTDECRSSTASGEHVTPSKEQVDAFVDYMRASFPPPATILANEAPSGPPGASAAETLYRVSIREVSCVEQSVFATFDFLNCLPPVRFAANLIHGMSHAWCGVRTLRSKFSSTAIALVLCSAHDGDRLRSQEH